MLTVDFDRLGLRPGERVLDMGCGAGRHAFEMYRRGADVIAFDQDADELADRARVVRRDARGRRGAGRRRGRRQGGRRARRCRSPTASSTGSSPPRCWSTSPPTSTRSRSWSGCCAPAARWRSPCRAGCPRWSTGSSPTTTTTPRAATSGSTPTRSWSARSPRRASNEDAGDAMVFTGKRPRPRPAHAVLVDQVRGRRHQRRPPARQGVPPAAGVGHHEERPRPLRSAEQGARPADRQEHGALLPQARAA